MGNAKGTQGRNLAANAPKEYPMVSIHDSLADVAKRVAMAEDRIAQQREHIQDLIKEGYDTAEAESLLELMLSALEQMRDVETMLKSFRRRPDPSQLHTTITAPRTSPHKR